MAAFDMLNSVVDAEKAIVFSLTGCFVLILCEVLRQGNSDK